VPDISNAHFESSSGILGTMAGLRPLLVSVWGTDVYDAPEQNAVMRTAIRYVLQRADRVLSTSRVMSEATRLLVQREVAITPFGVDTVRFAPDEGRAMCAPITRIGIVKALEKKYGVDVLLRAFRHVLNQRPGKGIELTVVGDGSQRSSLEDLSKELGIEGRTRFVGRVPYDRVHKMHQSFDIAVYPSVDRSETFGVSAVESQACGVPVVASNIGGLAEVVLDGSTGILVPPGDPAALAKAIGLLVDRPDIRQDYGAAARAHVLGSYSLDLSVDLMIKQYELALGARS
jgi:glycosyltransferase involved in cell wall biosynthesis